MAMTPVRAGYIVVAPQRFTNAHGDRLLADIQMRKARHLGAEIELIDLFLEATDLHHLPIEMNPAFIVSHGAFCWLYFVFFGSCHQGIVIGLGVMECWRDARSHVTRYSIPPLFKPAIFASTSNKIAKSLSASPAARALVSIWFVIAVVGSGTSS